MTTKWTVSVCWSTEVEAEDEGDALIAGGLEFSFMSQARADMDEDDHDSREE